MKTHKYTTMRKVFAALLLSGMFLMFADYAFSIGVCTNIDADSGTIIPLGFNSRHVVTGDLNGDNATDAVVAGVNTVAVLLNNGKGNLSVFTNLSISFTVGGLSLADFNLDGAPDLAIAAASSFSGGDNPLHIYFGNGNGSFSLPSVNGFFGSASAISTGDFNSDGFPDIAIANSGFNSLFGVVTIFLNAGFGNLSLAGNFPVGGVPRDIEAADFNGDNRLDIAVAGSNTIGSILFGNGDGSFSTASNFPLFTGVSSSFEGKIASGDFNNDARPDLVAVSGSSTNLSILLNNGSGNFSAPATINFPGFNFRPQAVVVGQFVGNGNLDIALVSTAFTNASSAAVVLQGNGDGTFSSNSTVSPAGFAPIAIAKGDFNQDGLIDLITANASSSDASVLLNRGNNRFGPRTFPTNPNPNQIVSADFDRDGNLDYAVSNAQSNPAPNSNGIRLYFGDGKGGVTRVVSLATIRTQALLIGDVNKDGRADLVAVSASTNQLYVYHNTQGTFANPANQIFDIGINFISKSMVLSDFNNDGNPDLAVTSVAGNSVALFLGRNDGLLNSPSIFASPASFATVVAGDFNNDNKSDLIFAGTGFDGHLGIFTLLGNGSGNFSPVTESFSVSTASSLAAGDFNADGRLDIAIATGSILTGGTNTVVVAFGDGDGTFTQSNTYSVGFNPIALVTEDVNNDNSLDLITANRQSNSISVLLNTRNGTFRSANSFLAGIFAEAVTLGDFNNDGRVDFATANSGGGNVSVILNTCLEAVTKTDYDGEGKTDFAVFRPSNGTWFVRNNDGSSESRALGMEGDIPAPGDYDGDGTTDFAVFRPSNGTWYIVRSSTNISYSVKWGTNGDIPVANDYDGDGRSDMAVFRPSNGTWYVIRSSQPIGFLALQFGQTGDVPVAADYDGDGRADIAVYRGGLWIIFQSSNLSVRFQQFGLASDKTVPGDYDGDGKADIAVYRGGNWYVFQSKSQTFFGAAFGLAGDLPQPGDYDGDGKTDLAVFRLGENNWYVLQSSNLQFRVVNFGNSGDIPVSSIYRY